MPLRRKRDAELLLIPIEGDELLKPLADQVELRRRPSRCVPALLVAKEGGDACDRGRGQGEPGHGRDHEAGGPLHANDHWFIPSSELMS